MIFFLIKSIFLIKNIQLVIVDEYNWSIAQYSYFYIAYNIYPTITIATIWKKEKRMRQKYRTRRSNNIINDVGTCVEQNQSVRDRQKAEKKNLLSNL
jgi:hypothetical protein